MLKQINTMCSEVLYGAHHKNVADLMCELRHTVKTIQTMTSEATPHSLLLLVNEVQESVPMDTPANRQMWRGFVYVMEEVIKEVKNELDANSP